jgi:hypothetical protein
VPAKPARGAREEIFGEAGYPLSASPKPSAMSLV